MSAALTYPELQTSGHIQRSTDGTFATEGHAAHRLRVLILCMLIAQVLFIGSI